MKTMLMAIWLALLGSAALAAPVAVSVVGVSATGNGKPFGNDPALIADGVIPVEGRGWNADASTYWNGKGKSITLEFDQVYQLHDLVLYADGSSSFSVWVSLDNKSWSDAYLIPSSGVGTSTTGNKSKGPAKDETGDPFDARSLSFAAGEVEPVFALYARIKANGGDKGGRYAVGELSFFGVAMPMPVLAAPAVGTAEAGAAWGEVGPVNMVVGEQIETTIHRVPEPGSLALLATGLLGAALGLRRRRA